MRYQTEHNNRVSLKADKILSVNQHRSTVITARVHDQGKRLPLLAKAKSKNIPLSKVEEKGTAKKVDPLPKGFRNNRKEQIKSKLQMQKRVFKLT
jgi:hypothetical protein